MTTPAATIPGNPRRDADAARAEYMMMCRACALFFFSGVVFTVFWMALTGTWETAMFVSAGISAAIGVFSLYAIRKHFSKRIFLIPWIYAVCIQLVLTVEQQRPAAGFFLLVPAVFCAIFYWNDLPVAIGGIVLTTAAYIAGPLLVGGETVVARVVTTTPIFLGLVLTTGYLGRQSVRMDRNRASFESTISSLLVALQERDGYTADHSEETVELAMAVGERLGIDDDERTVLADVALLHDIGKIGIPNEILNKAGGLDESEWEFMRKHPEIGERIVAPVPGFAAVSKAIRHEHERWDGGGYPDGIAGNEIPLASRIVLVCDAFHAMITDRPYRKAIGVAKAREELIIHSGSQFDPRVVEALLNVLDGDDVPSVIAAAL
jgi:HD-GYP domain-containing protein (c-di-GMP phosphodiesterase class II)